MADLRLYCILAHIVGKETLHSLGHVNSRDHLGKLYFRAEFCDGLEDPDGRTQP